MLRYSLPLRCSGTIGRWVVRSTRGLATDTTSYESLQLLDHDNGITEVQLNRPEKSNAMNKAFWHEIRECFHKLSILTQKQGLDLEDHMDLFAVKEADVSRKAWKLHRMIQQYQASFDAIEKVPQPVIAMVNGACVGGAMDMICACDIRLASADAFFSIKEVEIGLAADVGTLQRLPKIIGNDSLVRELAFTGRQMTPHEALRAGLLSSVEIDASALRKKGFRLAKKIAGLSPVAVQGTKLNLNYSRDHSTTDGLKYAAAWNAGMLQSEDIMEAARAGLQGSAPTFRDLE